jgi:hypothetical protein
MRKRNPAMPLVVTLELKGIEMESTIGWLDAAKK